MTEYGNQWSVTSGSTDGATGQTRADVLDSAAPIGTTAGEADREDVILQIMSNLPITPEGVSVASDLFGAILALILVYNQVID